MICGDCTKLASGELGEARNEIPSVSLLREVLNGTGLSERITLLPASDTTLHFGVERFIGLIVGYTSRGLWDPSV